MPQHPLPIRNYTTTAITDFKLNPININNNLMSVTIVPARNDWALLANTFITAISDNPPNDIHALVVTSPLANAPCLQVLGLDVRAKTTVKAFAKHAFHLPYGMSSWTVNDGFLQMVETSTPPAVPGTPYEFHDVMNKSRPEPLFEWDETSQQPEEVRVPARALVKGGFELNKPLLTGPLHMSPSVRVHLHEDARLYRPMFYGEETFSLSSKGATLVAPYIEDAKLTVFGDLYLSPSDGYRNLTSVSGDIPPNTQDNFTFKEFMSGSFAPIRSQANLRLALKDDHAPVLMCPSFGDGWTIEMALSKEHALEVYPFYTLRTLLECPPRVLSQNLFWNRGSIVNSKVIANGDMSIENALIKDTRFHIMEDCVLTLRQCLVLNVEVSGGGTLVVERSPCYRIQTSGLNSVCLRDMNHFTPVVESFENGRPIVLKLTGRVAGHHRKLKAYVSALKSENTETKDLVTLDYYTGRIVIAKMLEKLPHDEARFALLARTYGDWLNNADHDLKRRIGDTVPYFMEGLDMRQIMKMFMASENPELPPLVDIYTQMKDNL